MASRDLVGGTDPDGVAIVGGDKNQPRGTPSLTDSSMLSRSSLLYSESCVAVTLFLAAAHSQRVERPLSCLEKVGEFVPLLPSPATLHRLLPTRTADNSGQGQRVGRGKR